MDTTEDEDLRMDIKRENLECRLFDILDLPDDVKKLEYVYCLGIYQIPEIEMHNITINDVMDVHYLALIPNIEIKYQAHLSKADILEQCDGIECWPIRLTRLIQFGCIVVGNSEDKSSQESISSKITDFRPIFFIDTQHYDQLDNSYCCPISFNLSDENNRLSLAKLIHYGEEERKRVMKYLVQNQHKNADDDDSKLHENEEEYKPPEVGPIITKAPMDKRMFWTHVRKQFLTRISKLKPHTFQFKTTEYIFSFEFFEELFLKYNNKEYQSVNNKRKGSKKIRIVKTGCNSWTSKSVKGYLPLEFFL